MDQFQGHFITQACLDEDVTPHQLVLLVIEFFDSKNIIEPALEYLNSIMKHEHIIFWDAKAND